MSKHLKRITMPNTWPLQRKGSKFVTKPNPGAHSLKMGMALNSILKEMLGYAGNEKEIKFILNNGMITVDGIIRKEPKFSVGLMDVIKNEKTGETYRILVNKKEKLCLVAIGKEEASVKPCKIIAKTMVAGKKIQITLHDGRNMLSTNNSDYFVGDTLILKMPEATVTKHLKLEKNTFAIITKGKHMGECGIIKDIVGKESIEKTKIVFKTKESEFETLTDYAFIIGEGKPEITIKEE